MKSKIHATKVSAEVQPKEVGTPLPEGTIESNEEAMEPEGYDKGEIESAAEALMHAEEIRGNTGLHDCAMKHLNTKKALMHKVTGGHAAGGKIDSLEKLREVASEKRKAK